MVNITDAFIDHLFNKYQHVNQEQLYHQAKRCILDYMSVVFVGRKLRGIKGERLVAQFPDVASGATVIGYSRKKSPDTAAFLNGFISHVAELDDGVNSGIVHPGSPILSAMFAQAQTREVKGVDFLKGIIIGYETTIRLANCVQPAHKKRGYHATGTCGAVGAAVALSVMLNASEKVLKNAVSASIISAAGSLKALEDDSELKPFNVGNAAKAGVLAFFAAEAGFEGPKDALGGDIGFLNMKSGEYDVKKLIPHSSSFAINSIYIKPFAACRYCHPAIEAALKLCATNKIYHEDIESIEVSTYDLAVRNHDHTQVASMSSAKMSIPFSVATAIKHGRAGIAEFSDDCVNDSTVQRLTKKVSVCANPDYSAAFPQKSIAEIKVTRHNGKQSLMKVEHPKGEPENPMSDAELENKFKELSSYAGLSSQKANRIIHNIWNLENEFKQLFAHIS